MQLVDLAREDVDLIELELGDLLDSVRNLRPCLGEQFDDLLEVSGSLGDDQPELCQMATQRIDQLGALGAYRL